MKIVLIIISWLMSLTLFGTNYYIKDGGSDAAAGTSDGTAWGTITKVNSEWAAGTFAAGDSILFKRGNTFYGTITVAESGTSGSPIVIGAYGSGDKPIVSGFETITGWGLYSGSIESKEISVQSSPEICIVDGLNIPRGRFPKTEWAIADVVTTGSITDNELPLSPDYDGAEAVVRTMAWVIERRPNITHSSHTISFTAPYYPLKQYWGYFIQNDLDCLTADDEWAYLGGVMYFYNPGSKKISIPVRDMLIDIDGYDNIKVENLRLEGANNEAIFLYDAANIDINDCDFFGMGGYGIYGAYVIENVNVNNCTFDEINQMAIRLNGDNHDIINNTATNIGTLPGHGFRHPGDMDHEYAGFEIKNGRYATIEHNRLDTIGYTGISFEGQGAEVMYNWVNYFCFVKDDGGGIYIYDDFSTGKQVKHNFVSDGIGATQGRYESGTMQPAAEGLYNDGHSEGTTWDSNYVWNMGYAGFFNNYGDGLEITNNLFYNCLSGIYHVTDDATTNVTTGNVIVARENNSTYDQVAYSIILRNPISWTSIGSSNSNYFVRPISNDNYIEIWYDAWEWRYDNRQAINLSEWQSLSGLDANSHSTPVTVSSPDDLHFIYNYSAYNKYYTLSSPMVDAKNTSYSGTFTLSPWTAKVLIGAGTVTPGFDPVIPSGDGVFGKSRLGVPLKDKNGRIIIIQ